MCFVNVHFALEIRSNHDFQLMYTIEFTGLTSVICAHLIFQGSPIIFWKLIEDKRDFSWSQANVATSWKKLVVTPVSMGQ